MSKTFSQFKNDFYRRVPDPSVFDCEDFNLLKVVLDGLKVDYIKKGIYNEGIFKTSLLSGMILIAKRIKHFKAIRIAKNTLKKEAARLKVPFLFFDNGKVVENSEGEKVSFYFDKIQNYLGFDKSTTIYQSNTVLKNGIVVSPLYIATLLKSPSPSDKIFIKNIRQSYERLSALNVFTKNELQNIRIALNKFYQEYRFWFFLLKDSEIKFALFDEHYHREGFILALKRKNIKVIELQHGLIAKEDIFYVFPKFVESVASKAMFPDMIFTFGNYWSDVLKKGYEFRPEQIEVIGMYRESNTRIGTEAQSKMDKFLDGCDYILVTTQTFLHDYFVEYINWLSQDLLNRKSVVKIIVKIHPAEKIANYQTLQSFGNVMMFDVNTEYLLSRCKWHVSCYSTTLYDATKYSCNNFSLFIDVCSDYIDTFVKEGISVLINNNQNPVFLEQTGSIPKFDKKTLFENFDDHKYKLKRLEAL